MPRSYRVSKLSLEGASTRLRSSSTPVLTMGIITISWDARVSKFQLFVIVQRWVVQLRAELKTWKFVYNLVYKLNRKQQKTVYNGREFDIINVVF